MTSHDAAMPAIGTHILVLRDGAAESWLYYAAIVVGHLKDPVIRNAIELRLSDST